MIESVYDAFRVGDIPAIVAMCAPDVVWNMPSTLPYGGSFQGPAGVATFFERLATMLSTRNFAASDNLSFGSEVVSFGYHEGASISSGTDIRVDWAFRWTVEDGKVKRLESFMDTAKILAAM